MTVTVRLRQATIADRDEVVDVFLTCWHQSYVGVLPQDAIEAMTDDRASALWTRLLTQEEGTIIVAEDERRLLGVTRFATDDGTGIVHSLYVAPETHGLGVGTRLLQHAATAMKADGAGVLTLWVFANNASSIGFYRGRGWIPDGGSRIQEEFGEPELRLRYDGRRP